MTIRFIGPLLCGGLLLIATSAFAGDPVPGVGVAAGHKASGNAGAPTKNYQVINTTRSNIKHGSAMEGSNTGAPAKGGIAVNTSRSNIKHQ